MKKSECFTMAMLAVVDSEYPATVKLEIIESMLTEKHMAEMVEKCAQERKEKENG